MKLLTSVEAIEFLNDQCWHDSVLYDIRIIRTNSADQVEIALDLIQDYENLRFRRCTFTFNDCYYIETRMNGGVKCISDGEMIYIAKATNDSSYIDKVVDVWKEVLTLERLIFFSMNLSSTNSQIEIVCRGIKQTFDDMSL